MTKKLEILVQLLKQDLITEEEFGILFQPEYVYPYVTPYYFYSYPPTYNVNATLMGTIDTYTTSGNHSFTSGKFHPVTSKSC